MKPFRPMDIDWSGVVSYYGRRCLEFGLNPDVEELQRYNREAKVRACQHTRRGKAVGPYWMCRECCSRVPEPSPKEGTFRLSGTLWEAHCQGANLPPEAKR